MTDGEDPARRERNLPLVLLGAALLASALLLLALGSGLSFFQDTWAFFLNRREFTAHSLLAAHNEHIVVLSVAIQMLLLEVFGITSATPERVTLTVMLLATAALVFVYVRRRLGPWPALIGTVSLLFLGQAWEVLLWPFEISLVGSVLAGVATLLALDREDTRGDVAACLLLVISVAFSSLGVAFCAGAGVDVLLRHRSRGWGRVYVPAVPLLLYGAWYLGYGRDAESAASLPNALHAPVFMVEGFAASIGALLGLVWIAIDLSTDPRQFLALAGVLGFAALFAYLWRRHRPALHRLRDAALSPRFWPAATAAVTFWLLAGLNRVPGREAISSRYLYIGGVFVLLIAADLLRTTRLRTPTLIVAAIVALAAAASNLVPLTDGADFLEEQTVLTRADLGAIEIAERTVDPNFTLTPEVAGTSSLIDIRAGDYLEMAREHGSAAYTPAELARAPEAGRRAADVVLASALPLTTETVDEKERRPASSCVAVGGGTARSVVPVYPSITSIAVPAGASAVLSLQRFARAEYPVPIEGVEDGSTILLEVPADASPRPWRLRVESERAVEVCPLG